MAASTHEEIRLLAVIAKDMKTCTVLLENSERIPEHWRLAADIFLQRTLTSVYDLHKHFDPLFGLQGIAESVKKMRYWLLTFQPTEKMYAPQLLMPSVLYAADTDRIIVIPKDE